MYLYSLLLPRQQQWNIDEMYFRTDTDEFVTLRENCLDCKKGSIVSFDTYFNAFSIGKWKKYTLLNTLNINIDFEGSFRLMLYDCRYQNKSVKKIKVFEKTISSQSRCVETVQLSLDSLGDMLSFVLIGRKNSFFYGGFYSTDIDEEELGQVNLAVTMCTYHREKYVERNLKVLTREVFENSSSPLKEHLKTYIADNGQSLDAGRLSSDFVKIYPQPSYGGSGGFVRGILELLRDKEHDRHTHILLMDDDVTIEPQAFEKNYSFLRLIRSEFSDRQVGGAMLRTDRKMIQAEQSGIYKGYGIQSVKANIDLSDFANVVFNEIEEPHDYQAWFYACIPIKTYLQHGFSLPFFMKYDDVEYGLRLKPSITLNGIFVWHDGFEYKRNGIALYYTERNKLIVHALYKRTSLARILLEECRQICAHIALARYRFAEMELMAVQDFCKGPLWLLHSDARRKYEQLSAMDYKYVHVSPKQKKQFKQIGRLRQMKPCGKQMKYRWRPKEELVVSDTDAKSIAVCMAKRIIYFNRFSNSKYEIDRDLRRAMMLVGKTMRVMLSFLKNYRWIQRQYGERYEEMCSEKLWRDYLNSDVTGNGSYKYRV